MNTIHDTFCDLPIQYRNTFGDVFIKAENSPNRNVYDKLVPLQPDDCVLDIGAHIGFYSLFAATRPVKRVVSVECEPNNFILLSTNIVDTSIIAIYKAVVGENNDAETVAFYPNAGTNTGGGSLYIQRGRSPILVETVKLSSLLRDYNPTYIKCDCEGAEYEIFADIELPRTIRAVVIELHLQKKIWRTEGVYNIINWFESQDFNVVGRAKIAKQRTLLLGFTREPHG